MSAEPEKLERVPPETVRSEPEKSFDDSERVKERVAVSPALREEVFVSMAMLGIRVAAALSRFLMPIDA